MTRQTDLINQPDSSKIKQASKTQRTRWWSKILFIIPIIFLVFLLAVMVIGVVIAPFWLWLIFAAIMIALLAALGLRVNSHVLGILIDSRNRISLSRTQIMLWTVLVLSAFLAMALPRSLPGGTTGPLNITFPTELVTVLGISAASLAGATFVKSNKTNKETRLATDLQNRVEQARSTVTTQERQLSQLTSEAAVKWSTLKAQQSTTADAELIRQSLKGQVEHAREDLDKAEKTLQFTQQNLTEFTEIPREGVIKINLTSTGASLLDMFTGDEIGNFDRVDLSKVQMFLLTVVILMAYTAALYDLLLDQAAVFDPLGVSLPAFSASVSTLLAISHGGYLAVKAVDHSKAA